MPRSTYPVRVLRTVFLLLALITPEALLSSRSASAQSVAPGTVNFTLGGLVQAEASHGWVENGAARVGIGLRRVRLRASAQVGPKAGAFMHIDADPGTFLVLDAFVFYDVAPRVRMRLGRMASAQPRAFIFTPVMAMDATERAAIALLWNGSTLGNKGRDFGLDVRYQAERGEAILFLHNGDGTYDRGNFQQSIVGNVTGGRERDLRDMAISGYAAYRPAAVSGLEVGGFAGYNGNGSPNTVPGGVQRPYFSYAAHAYWGAEPGSQPIRLKADLISVRHEERLGIAAQQSLGLSGLAAVAVHRAGEVFGRVESYEPDRDASGAGSVFLTLGGSFSPSALRGLPYARERLTLGYSARLPEAEGAPSQHLIVLQAQIFF